MRPLLIVMVVLIAVVFAAARYMHESSAARDASASRAVVSEPAAPALSLEERAARAQGTSLPPEVPRSNPRQTTDNPVERVESAVPSRQYRCDGRTRCPQMHSCEEATWFLRNCPGTKMDGDNDGVPCEDQFCVGR